MNSVNKSCGKKKVKATVTSVKKTHKHVSEGFAACMWIFLFIYRNSFISFGQDSDLMHVHFIIKAEFAV